MKRTISIFFTIGIVTILLAFTIIKTNPQEDKNYNDCIEKYKSEWGTACQSCTYSTDIYKVFLRNICTEHLDVMTAVQENDKSWRCLFKENLAPKDTFVAFACKGTGKYLIWARKSGNREIVLPTCQEINQKYK